MAGTGPDATALEDHSESRILRADNWCCPYYGLPPVATVAVPPTVPAGESRQLLLDRKGELERELLSVNALLNAGVPINRLPVELLAAIFQTLRMTIVEGNSLHWITCLLVCRHWFTVAATTPRLWSFLWAVSSLNYARTCLIRSKGVEVDVSLPRVPHMVQPLLRLVGAHAYKIRQLALTVVSQKDGPRLKALMQNPMPALESFHAAVTKTLFNPSEVAIEFAPEHFPKLVDVRIGGIHLVPTLVLRQLKVLSIRIWLGLVPGLTRNMLTILLRELTCVEELFLSDVKLRDVLATASDPPAPSGRAVLLNLRSLTLENTDTEVLSHILSVISVPLSAAVVIKRRIFAAEGFLEAAVLQGARAVLPEDRTGLPMLSRAETASVWMEDAQHAVQLEIPGRPGSVLITMEIPEDYMADRFPHLDDFVDICRGAPQLQRLRIKAPPNRYAEMRWREAFAPFPKLRALTVVGNDYATGAKHIFGVLDPESAPADTPEASRVVLPGLEELRIEGSSARDAALVPAIVQCLQHRRDVLERSEALEELVLELGDHRSLQYFEEQKALYTEALSEYVEEFLYGMDDDTVQVDN